MKTCRFIRKEDTVSVPSPDSWLGGWARQRWLERHFKDAPARSASADAWADLCSENEVFVLSEVNGDYREMSLKNFRNIEKEIEVKKYDTYFCDIDGTIFKYRKFETYESSPAELTPRTLDKFKEIKDPVHMIVLTTARPEDLRDHTVTELETNGVPYDKLVMGLARGPSHLVNDMDPKKPGMRAIIWNLVRDHGMSQISVEK